jgi:NADH-quinone oxidoreductase subunit M
MHDTLTQLLPLAVATPLVCALALAFGRQLPERLVQAIALVGFGFPVVVAALLWWHYPVLGDGGFVYRSQYSTGLEALGIALKFGLNGISLPLFVMAAVVGLAAGLFALQSNAERLHLYLLLLLTMHGGLLGMFAVWDVFFFYFFHELALIPTFILVGIWGGRDRTYAAMKMTIYLTLGAMLSLAGLIAIYVASGADTFDLVVLRAVLANEPIGVSSQVIIFGLLFYGFGILVSLWPFHTWAPLGYGAAPTSAAMLHAGVLKKFGLYGLVQIALPLVPEGAQGWAHTLAWLALGNIIVVGLITLAQRDLKQMIGYGSVMHVGYGFMGVACLSLLGAGGVVLFMVAHGLTVSLLFLLATCVHHRAGTFDMEEIGGLVQKAPVLAAFFLTAMLASIGLPGPGLLNFWGELTIFMAVYDHAQWMVAPAALGVVISAIYGLRAVGRVFYGQPTETFKRHAAQHEIVDLRWSERIPALLLLVTLIALGVWPKAITTPLNDTLEAIYPVVEAAARVALQP